MSPPGGGLAAFANGAEGLSSLAAGSFVTTLEGRNGAGAAPRATDALRPPTDELEPPAVDEGYADGFADALADTALDGALGRCICFSFSSGCSVATFICTDLSRIDPTTSASFRTAS